MQWSGLIISFWCHDVWPVFQYSHFQICHLFCKTVNFIPIFLPHHISIFFTFMQRPRLSAHSIWLLAQALCCRPDSNPGCQFVFLVSVFRDCWEGQGFSDKERRWRGIPKGFSPRGRTYFYNLTVCVRACVRVDVLICMHGPRQPAVSLSSTSKEASILRWRGTERGTEAELLCLTLFLSVCQCWPRWVWYRCA